MTKEQTPTLEVDYSQDELDAATREVIANDIVEGGQAATEENIEIISRIAKKTYLTIGGKGKRKSLMNYWEFSRHRAVKRLLSKKNVEKGRKGSS